MLELRAIIEQAVVSEKLTLTCDSQLEANNIRQRFYRYRDKIRASDDELNLIVDSLVFELVGEDLVISYNPPDKLLEKINVN